jgi:hypothetical protein
VKITPIDPNIEKPFRKALGYAARAEAEEMAVVLENLSQAQAVEGIALCAFTAAYTAMDVVGRQWPDEANLRRMAAGTVTGANARKLSLTEQDVYDFIERVSIRFEPIDRVFPEPDRMITLPYYITAHLLVSFGPSEQQWWEFLDRAEAAYEVAQSVDLDVLPALMLRARRESPQ